MTEFDNIIKRSESGYTMARFGSREDIHYQMANDIDYLIELVKDSPSDKVLSNSESLIRDIKSVRGVTLIELKSRSTSPRIATARRVYFFIAVNYLSYSKADLAREFGKSRATITKSLLEWDNNERKRLEETAIYADVLTKYKNK